MRKRRQKINFRFVLKWVGTCACALLVALAMIGARGVHLFSFELMTTKTFLGMNRGLITIVIEEKDSLIGYSSAPGYFGWPPRSRSWYWWFGYSSSQAGGGWYFLRIPIWVPFLLIAVPTILLWRTDRRSKLGCCAKCGYDLRGCLQSTRCPECGTRIAPSTKNAAA